ncbi:transposase zinc-binding domain-containing protein [Sorangium sp. So ce1078]
MHRRGRLHSTASGPAATGRPRLEVADIVRAHGEAYLRAHAVSAAQRKVLRDIAACRTAVLGGHVDVCTSCGHEQPSYNSCRNRHCPKCQSLSQARWIAERQQRILPTHYFHVVFTLPAELRPLALSNTRRAHGDRPVHLSSLRSGCDGSPSAAVVRRRFFRCSSGHVMSIAGLGRSNNTTSVSRRSGIDPPSAPSMSAACVLALKANQTKLYKQVAHIFSEAGTGFFSLVKHTAHETVEEGHGRRELRRVWTTTDLSRVEEAAADSRIVATCSSEGASTRYTVDVVSSKTALGEFRARRCCDGRDNSCASA